MLSRPTSRSWTSLLGLTVAVSLGCAPADFDPASDAPAARSSFGSYTNEEAAVWDGWQRTSQYVPADDGTRLAVTVMLRGGGSISGGTASTVAGKFYRDFNAARMSRLEAGE